LRNKVEKVRQGQEENDTDYRRRTHR